MTELLPTIIGGFAALMAVLIVGSLVLSWLDR